MKKPIVILNDIYGKDPKRTDIYYPLTTILKAMEEYANQFKSPTQKSELPTDEETVKLAAFYFTGRPIEPTIEIVKVFKDACVIGFQQAQTLLEQKDRELAEQKEAVLLHEKAHDITLNQLMEERQKVSEQKELIEKYEDALESIVDGRAFDKQSGLIWEHQLEHIKTLLTEYNKEK